MEGGNLFGVGHFKVDSHGYWNAHLAQFCPKLKQPKFVETIWEFDETTKRGAMVNDITPEIFKLNLQVAETSPHYSSAVVIIATTKIHMCVEVGSKKLLQRPFTKNLRYMKTRQRESKLQSLLQ